MRKLGIDFGLSRIGFAISDESNSFSLALENFDYDGSYEKNNSKNPAIFRWI